MYAEATCCKLVLIVLFLCSDFIMSQASTTTTPPVTVVCSGTLSLAHNCYHGPHLDGVMSNIRLA